MIERETRRYELHSIEHPDHPDFARAYQILWDAFGPQGEMEPEAAIRRFLLDDAYEADAVGHLHPLLPPRRQGPRRPTCAACATARCCTTRRYAPDLCLVYLSHIFMLPRGARHGAHLLAAHRAGRAGGRVPLRSCTQRGLVTLPQPDQPGKYFGMRLDLAAEMEYFSPEDRAVAAAHPVLRPRRLRRHRPAPLPLPAARFPRSGGDPGDRQHAGAVHAAAAPHGPRAAGAAAARRGAAP